ncbi:MAG: anthranilate phosphoribosyltransferase [Limisphaerales bacterium]
MLERYIEKVSGGGVVSDGEVAELVELLTREDIEAGSKAAFLTALAQRGERSEEIAAFASALRELAVRPVVSDRVLEAGVLDIVGTGGDRLNTFNISSTAALLVSAAGVAVAKHGNRAITSKSGSADVLEALGIRIELEPAEVGEWLERYGFAFLFAPRFHPAFKHIAPARRLCAEAGQRTLFNFLGPLLNPVRPSSQLMGVSSTALCEPLAKVLQALGVRRGMVVCGNVPLSAGGPEPSGAVVDELSTLGSTQVAEFYQEKGFSVSSLEPELFPLQRATLADLRGGDREFNAELTRRILGGQERGPCRDCVLLNAGAALFVAGVVDSVAAGWDKAMETIDSGVAMRHLGILVEASR